MSLGTHLTKIRKATGLNLTEAADKLGITRQAVAKWEADSGTPDIRMAKRLAVLYGCTLDELLGYEKGDVLEPRDCQVQAADWKDAYPILGTYPNEIDTRQMTAALETLVEHLVCDYEYRTKDAVLVLQDILANIAKKEK